MLETSRPSLSLDRSTVRQPILRDGFRGDTRLVFKNAGEYSDHHPFFQVAGLKASKLQQLLAVFPSGTKLDRNKLTFVS
jgi:hypothetical protein